MRYFAMIDGERRGPFTLEQLQETGITPETYVWCKGMEDWRKAEDVADICRFYRLRIFNLMHPSVSAHSDSGESSRNNGEDSPGGGGGGESRFIGRFAFPPEEVRIDDSREPMSMLTVALLLTILCFPPTGFIALYYAVKTRRTWEQATHGENSPKYSLTTDEERRNLRLKAHDYSRSAKMWSGITFFMGMIFMSFFVHTATR